MNTINTKICKDKQSNTAARQNWIDGLNINKFMDYSECSRKALSLQKVKIELSSKIAEIWCRSDYSDTGATVSTHSILNNQQVIPPSDKSVFHEQTSCNKRDCCCWIPQSLLNVLVNRHCRPVMLFRITDLLQYNGSVSLFLTIITTTTAPEETTLQLFICMAGYC